MEQNRDEKVEKRRPGRPIGTTKTLHADEALMRHAAAEMVRENHLRFSTALRGLGVAEYKDLARLRKRWKIVGDTYLAHARTEMRADQTIGQNLLELFRFLGVFEGVRAIGQTLRDSRLLPRLREITQSADSAGPGRDAMELPFDPKDLNATIVAIVRMEARDRSFDDALHQKEETNEPLSSAEQMYLMAVALHAMALNQFELDEQNDQS